MKPLALHSILVATDLSEDMAPALVSAGELAALTGAQLNIVHAIEEQAERDQLADKLTRLNQLAGRELDISILAGPAAAVITQEAIRTRADVIVVGRHRSRAGRPGSTADRVVRTSRIPCLILCRPLSLPFSTVLVPVDLANATGPLAVALTWASALRRRSHSAEEQTQVEVLHVQTANEINPEELDQRLRAELAKIKQGTAQFAGVQITQRLAESADVPGSIADQAERPEIDLLVMGTRARRIESDPLGSVTSAVAQRATCPLLLVPPEVWRSAGAQL
jgi:nucleotide-binding universal stress UspA family protein